jgi:serine/threonine-protein kinase TTK/MPS1
MKLELVGRGGSSKVFKVLASDGKLYALKRVQLRGVDATTVAGYINEMSLLKRLQECEHIIKLIDAEVDEKEGYLHMVRNQYLKIPNTA